MDSNVGAAARALASGHPLEALKYVALLHDARSVALRGIAMAQLGELARARTLLRRAAAAFLPSESLERARTVVAQAEVALALRDLSGAARDLTHAVSILTQHGDTVNAAFARIVDARRLALLGEVDEAARVLAQVQEVPLPPRFVSRACLVAAELAMKRLDSEGARTALMRARAAARASRHPALEAEVAHAERELAAPVARLITRGVETDLSLAQLPALLAAPHLLVDGCRREVRLGARVVSLVSRPLLLQLLVELATHAPADVARDTLITRLFSARKVNDSHRVRLRVEIGRLRKLLAGMAELRATRSGYTLAPGGAGVALLLPPQTGEASALLALLRDGDAWATSALASALGKSQRAVQRALAELEQAGKVRGSGKGRARRWVATPTGGLATPLLLAAPGTLG